MKHVTYGKHFVVCVNNEGNEASLERRKIYRALPDQQANAQDLIRIVDESGESYLYPAKRFIPIKLSQSIVKAFARAA